MPASQAGQPAAGHYAKADVPPHRHLVEVRVDDPAAYKLGQEITVADVLEAGKKADVTGVTKGKGFAGVMKRHNFKGQGASHGAHKVHRAPGAIGACATPARVFKGKRMPGRMGGEQRTVLNLDVVEVDGDRNLLLRPRRRSGPQGSGRGRQRGGEGSWLTSSSPSSTPPTAPARVRSSSNPEIFGIEPNVAVMHQVVTAQLAAARAGTHSTKTRAEVRGGGRKPWRQKGLGRARHGSIRSPQWAGGGVAHGPKPRDYAQRDSEEDEAPRPAQRPVRPSGCRPDQGRRALRRLGRRPRRSRPSRCSSAMGVTGKVLLIAEDHERRCDQVVPQPGDR